METRRAGDDEGQKHMLLVMHETGDTGLVKPKLSWAHWTEASGADITTNDRYGRMHGYVDLRAQQFFANEAMCIVCCRLVQGIWTVPKTYKAGS